MVRTFGFRFLTIRLSLTLANPAELVACRVEGPKDVALTLDLVAGLILSLDGSVLVAITGSTNSVGPPVELLIIRITPET